ILRLWLGRGFGCGRTVSRVVVQSYSPDASEVGYMRVSEGERGVVMEDDESQDFIVGVKPSTGEKGKVPRSMLGRTSMTDDGPRVAPSPTSKAAKDQEIQNSVPFSNSQPTTPTSSTSPTSSHAAKKAERPTRPMETKSSGDYGH